MTPGSAFPTDELPTPNPCISIWFNGRGATGDGKVMWTGIWNGTPDDIWIETIHVYWPDPPNRNLKKVRLNGDTIWDAVDGPPDAWISGVTTTGIQAFSNGYLEFEFELFAEFSGYWMQIWFTNGCYIEGGG